jgi:hypothetical protein
MTRRAEARFWQAVGAIVAIAGGGVLGYALAKSGLEFIQLRPFFMGLAGSFLVLTGGACFIAGRVLHVGETVLTRGESVLWKVLTAVCLVGGSVVLVLAWREGNDLVLDRLATGLAGAFAMMFGVLCLLGERVMSHMRDALVAAQKSAKRAGA